MSVSNDYSTSHEKVIFNDYQNELSYQQEPSYSLAIEALQNAPKKTRQLTKMAIRKLVSFPDIAKPRLAPLLLSFLFQPGLLQSYMKHIPSERSEFSLEKVTDETQTIKILNALLGKIKLMRYIDKLNDFDQDFPKYAFDLDTLMTLIGYRGVGLRQARNKNEIPQIINDFLIDLVLRKTALKQNLMKREYFSTLIEENKSFQRVLASRPGPDIEKSNTASRSLARMVLENSSLEIKQLTKTALRKLGNLVEKYDLNAEDLDFFMEAVPNARSEFSLQHAPKLKKRLKRITLFLEKLKTIDQTDDFDQNFPKYASDLDTLMTAIGYRVIGPPWVKNKTLPSERVTHFLAKFREEGYLAPNISKEFPFRKIEGRVSEVHYLRIIEIPQGTQDEVIGGRLGEHPGLPLRRYNYYSYVNQAMSSGIPMRAHVSGSASLTLAALKFVMEGGDEKIDLNEDRLIKFSGLLCAVYELGDFHTFTETAAGVANFYQNTIKDMQFCNDQTKRLDQIEPKNFTALSMVFLSSIVSEEKQLIFSQMSHEILECAESGLNCSEAIKIKQHLRKRGRGQG